MTAIQVFQEIMTMQNHQTQNAPAYLRLADVRTRYRVSRSTIWKWAASPETGFPKPIKLGANTTCWKLADLLAWEQSRIAASQAGK
jgi:prophage regulatory protein